MMLSFMDVFLRLSAATMVGGVIGFEREKSSQPAGFRTHILVTVGAALIMIISTTRYLPGTVGNDPMRLAAQVVSGIGFLGAGTILKEGTSIRGLTSATCLWVCAAIGLAFGAGMYIEGFATGFIAFLTLTLLIRWERRLFKDKFKKQNLMKLESASSDSYLKLFIKRDLSKGLIEDVEDVLREHRMIVTHISIGNRTVEKTEGDRVHRIEVANLAFQILPENDRDRNYMDACLGQLRNLPGVCEVSLSIAHFSER